MQPETISLVLALVAILEIPIFVTLTTLLGGRKRRADDDRRWEERLRDLEDWKNRHAGEHRGYERGVSHVGIRPLFSDDLWRDPREVNEPTTGTAESDNPA